jgi:hypothetical protein
MTRHALAFRLSHLVLTSAALAAGGCATRLSPADAAAREFAGGWALADTEGDLFDVIVRADGTAVTNWSKGAAGARGERGTWTPAAGGEGISLSYDSGWRDVIQRAGRGYSKRSYGPGVPVSAVPTNEGVALRVRGPVLPFVGVWETSRDGGAAEFLAMKSDGSARRTGAPSATGRWSVSDGAARVEWSDGSTLVIRPERGGFVCDERRAGVASSRAACRPVGGVPAAPPRE